MKDQMKTKRRKNFRRAIQKGRRIQKAKGALKTWDTPPIYLSGVKRKNEMLG